MITIKGKIRICQSNIADFNVEHIDGVPFYKRYHEFLSVFRKYINEYNSDIIFSQPIENTDKATIDWYIPETEEIASSLDSIKKDDIERYSKLLEKRNIIISYLKNIAENVNDTQDKKRLSCAIKYLDNDYSEKVTYVIGDDLSFTVWGMKMRKGKQIETIITDNVREHRTHSISYRIKGKGSISGQTSLIRKHGHILEGKDIPEIIAENHYSHVRWEPFAPHGKKVEDDLIFIAVCERVDDYCINFIPYGGGTLEGEGQVYKKGGIILSENDIPFPKPQEGFHFKCWEPAIDFDSPICDDLTYTALFEKDKESLPPPIEPMCKVIFNTNGQGTIDGQNEVLIPKDAILTDDIIPKVTPNKGLEFMGWDQDIKSPITEDKTFNAQFVKIPWYRRFWLWLTGLFDNKGCLKWILWTLLLIFFLWILSWFFRGCLGCSNHSENGVRTIETKTRPDGTIIDNNGYSHPITDEDGTLPDDNGIVAPIYNEDGEDLPIIDQPGTPKTIANRLFLFMENENDDIDALAKDFKKVYPEDGYDIIGFDREVKLLVIQIPESEKDQIRQTINNKIPNHDFIVFDEEIYELNGTLNPTSLNPGWHLNAIHLKEGWQTTRGDKSIKVAIIDDGIESSHPMFKGRIVDAYNVFTQNNNLSKGIGHGTHTAGLAVGCADFFDNGAAGVAPECSLMPVQVFDNNQCPLSALISGIMYAIHHDADVINVSIAPSFKGLNMLPPETQEQIAEEQFKNIEKLWSRVCKLASEKNSIIVLAAGNDDILSSIPPENRNNSAIVVTAVDKNLYPTVFTNYGPCSDISAPGKDIYSSYPTESFQSFDGTSMAAPIVAGTIALMKSIKKDLTVEQAKNVLYKSGADVYGFIPPMVLVDAALTCVKKGDFGKPSERELRPVPDGSQIDSSAGTLVEIISPTPEQKAPISSSKPQPPNKNDYDEIRRLIKEYEQKIEQLKKQLPENQK